MPKTLSERLKGALWSTHGPRVSTAQNVVPLFISQPGLGVQPVHTCLLYNVRSQIGFKTYMNHMSIFDPYNLKPGYTTAGTSLNDLYM